MDWLRKRRLKASPGCPICGRQQQLAITPELRGRQAEVEVIFNDLPTLTCGQTNHPGRFADPEFGVRLIEAVFWKKEFALARPGFRGQKIKCLACGKDLTKEDAYRGEVSGQVAIPRLPPFELWINGPVVACPRCGREQLKASREVGAQVSSAFVDAFQKIGLKP